MKTTNINENLVNNSNQTQNEQKQIINESKIIKMNTTENNKDLVNNSNKTNSNEFQDYNFNGVEIEVCEIQCFELEDIIENPTDEEIEIWNELSNNTWDGELCSSKIRKIWKEELLDIIEERKGSSNY